MKKKSSKLQMWQERLAENKSKFSTENAKMDGREKQYAGDTVLQAVFAGQQSKQLGTRPAHLHNIVAENIESEIDNNVPMPKVTARKEADAPLAKMIEDMLRNELDRLPMEMYNDQCERTVPIQGGTLHHIEWDNTLRTHDTVGEVTLTMVHPKQVIPQDGVYNDVEDMDYIFLQIPQTKSYVLQRYGVDVSEETESAPETKSVNGHTADDMVTINVAYYRNDKGGIGKYSWVNDIELEDLEDYQARRVKRCVVCGALKPLNGDLYAMDKPTLDGTPPEIIMAQQLSEHYTGDGSDYAAAVPLEGRGKPKKPGKESCPYCGSDKWEDSEEEYEEIYTARTLGNYEIPNATVALNDKGEAYLKPMRIPFYKPNIYPVVLQKNVSVFGRFLGESDVDKISTQQNTINHLDNRINRRLMQAGSRVTLPIRPDFEVNDEEGIWYLESAAEKQMIDVYSFSGDLQYEMLRRNEVYEQARQILGVTNSFQGREEGSTSGKAREIMAAQSAGRLESKRVMKYAAYARIFEIMFKFRLAYADEKRPVTGTDGNGNVTYDSFDRYKFLKQDEQGEWYWEDNFIFSCDNASSLASNREKMWEECTAHLQAGAYGNPAEIETLILYWSKMEGLHYPGAGETKTALEARLEQQKQQQQMMLQMQMAQQAAAAAAVPNPM